MRTRAWWLSVTVGLTALPLARADQTGAEAVKKPVSAAIVDVRRIPEWSGDPVGNVEVTYADQTKDHWTKLAVAMMPKVAPDGVVGWVDCSADGSKELELHDRIQPVGAHLVLCDHGKVAVRIASALPFIESWGFDPDGKHVVVKSRASHGPALIQRFVRATGDSAGEVRAFEEQLPKWAKPYGE